MSQDIYTYISIAWKVLKLIPAFISSSISTALVLRQWMRNYTIIMNDKFRIIWKWWGPKGLVNVTISDMD